MPSGLKKEKKKETNESVSFNSSLKWFQIHFQSFYQFCLSQQISYILFEPISYCYYYYYDIFKSLFLQLFENLKKVERWKREMIAST